jgi:hypothetical protein
MADTALRLKILCCIICWYCLALSFVNCYYYTYRRNSYRCYGLNFIIYLFIMYIWNFLWFVGDVNGQHVTNVM